MNFYSLTSAVIVMLIGSKLLLHRWTIELHSTLHPSQKTMNKVKVQTKTKKIKRSQIPKGLKSTKSSTNSNLEYRFTHTAKLKMEITVRPSPAVPFPPRLKQVVVHSTAQQ